jgi:hypothetical protein
VRERNIKLNLVIPFSPAQNGAVERQNKTVKSFIRACKAERRDWVSEIDDFVLIRNTTVSVPTGKSPDELFMGRKLGNGIPQLQMRDASWDTEARDNDAVNKLRSSEAVNKERGAKRSSIEESDIVWLQNNEKRSKLDTNYMKEKFRVVERKGTELRVTGMDSGAEYRRNVNQAKKVIENEAEEGESVNNKGVRQAADGRPKRDIKKPKRYQEDE